MPYLPGWDNPVSRSARFKWTRPQIIAYLSLFYLDIAVYAFLILLALRNVWAILVKQGEYKNLPIVMFYVFALIAIATRIICLFFYWDQQSHIADNLSFIQQSAKICVGFVQDWVTLELAIRIHNSKNYTDISEAAKERLRAIRRLLFAVIALAFYSVSIDLPPSRSAL